MESPSGNQVNEVPTRYCDHHCSGKIQEDDDLVSPYSRTAWLLSQVDGEVGILTSELMLRNISLKLVPALESITESYFGHQLLR